MLRDFLNESGNIPNLTYHTMNKCDEFIVFYGGLFDISEFSGDLYILKSSKNKVVCASYSEHTNSKKNNKKNIKKLIKNKVSLNQDIHILQFTIVMIKRFIFSAVL
jgi:hypothetical protein